MWFGSGVGLTRYDSQSYINFSVEDSLTANEVLAITSDSASTLWAGTGLGLSAFDISDISHPKYLFSPKEFINYSISSLLYTNNKLWIGTRRNGLYIYESDRNGYKIQKIKNSEIKDICVAGKYVVVLHNGGLSFYSKTGHEVKQISITNKRLKCISHVKDSVIYIGTGNGLIKLLIKTGTLSAVHPQIFSMYDFNYIVCDKHGVLWAGIDRGLLKVKENSYEVIGKRKGLPGNDLRALCFDNEGNLWLGSYISGLFKLNNTNLINYNEREGLLSNVVNCIFNESVSQKLIGTDLGVFKIKNYVLSRDKRFNKLNKEIIWFIYSDNKEHIWIGGENVLYRYFNGKLRKVNLDLIHSDCTYLDMVQDAKGTFWLCTTIGLYSLKNGISKSYPEFKNKGIRSFWDVKELTNGDILFGTDNGLIIYHNNSFKVISQKDGLPDRAVYVIYEDKNGTIWLGADRGLIKKKADTFKLFSTAEGLYGTIISQILEDDSGLWLCTDKGLQFFKDDKPGHRFGLKDGLLGEEFTTQNSSLIDKDGNFWLGVFGGLTIFNPYKSSNTKIKPIVYLTEANYSSAREKKSFLDENNPTIEYSDNNVMFQLLGLYFYNESSLKYTYQLQGLDEQWYEADRGEIIRYNNLPAGNYSLLVKTIIDGQVAGDINLFKNFSIASPLWQQTWFVALSVLFIVAVIYGITVYSNRKILAINKALQNKIDNNIKQLAIAQATIENIVEHSGSVLVSTDLRGRITTWNKRAEEVFGYSKDFILRKNIKILDLDDDLWGFMSVLDEVKKSGELRQLEIKKKTANGTIVDIIVSTNLLKDKDGKTHLVTFSMEDFSERNKLLEFRINREKMLGGIEALNNLLATLSHHINNSTASISGMAQLAEIDTKYQKKFFEVTNFQVFRIQAVLKSLGKLVDQLNLKTKNYVGDSESLFDIDEEIAGFINSLDKITNLKLK